MGIYEQTPALVTKVCAPLNRLDEVIVKQGYLFPIGLFWTLASLQFLEEYVLPSEELHGLIGTVTYLVMWALVAVWFAQCMRWFYRWIVGFFGIV